MLPSISTSIEASAPGVLLQAVTANIVASFCSWITIEDKPAVKTAKLARPSCVSLPNGNAAKTKHFIQVHYRNVLFEMLMRQV